MASQTNYIKMDEAQAKSGLKKTPKTFLLVIQKPCGESCAIFFSR